jgi:hypothetical protein
VNVRGSPKIWEHVGAASGAVAAVLTTIDVLLSDPARSGLDPDPTDSSSMIARALVEVRSSARTGAVLGLVGAFLLIWFVAYLRGYLVSYEGPGGWMAAAADGGGIVAIALLLVADSITLAATELTGYGGDTLVAKVFLMQGWNYFYVVSPPLMALVVAASVVTLRFGGLPKWLAILGLILLVLSFVAGAGLGALLGLLWVLLASLVLTARSFRQSTSLVSPEPSAQNPLD